MKVLALTGLLAEKIVRQYAISAGPDIDVLALPISVAAFITPGFAANYLRSMNLSSYNMILTPGTIEGDVSEIEIATGVPTFKGPIHAADISLSFMEGLKLSKILPASDVARDLIKQRTDAKITQVKEHWRELFPQKASITIGRRDRIIPCGAGFPMPVIAEIVNAPKRDLKEIENLSKYYESSGAEVIDIGMLANVSFPEKIDEIIETIRASVNLPISIDTLNEKEILAAINSGVDLILSLDAGNIDELAQSVHDIPVVILPSNIKKAFLAKDPETRVNDLIINIDKARKLGIEKIIADPVLEPVFQPGLMNSLAAYRLFREKDESTPMLFGLGNVTELIDIDSIGVNGLLTALAYEVGANILFTPEYSVKGKGSVVEISTASKMMFLAQSNDSVPKDLGIDLLILKEKRWLEQPKVKINKIETLIVDGLIDVEYVPDKVGWFKIQIDRENKLIEAVFYHYGESIPAVNVVGKNATEIYQTIIRRKMIGSLGHAAYLGRELEKAEIALKLGRSYVQEESLF